nr:reverse transcriptase domain-containing protein [Tanacetum cinerariifolium]
MGGKEKNVYAHSESHYQGSRSRRTDSVPRKHHYEGTCSRRTEMLSESEDSEGGHWKSKSKKQKSSIEEDDLSQPWLQRWNGGQYRHGATYSTTHLLDPLGLRPEVKNQMVPATAILIGFSEQIIWPMGQILLQVKIGDAEHSTSTWMNFLVVRSPSSYNGIIGRPGVRKIQAVLSTAHGMLKFPVPGGILTLRSSMIVPLECTMVSRPKAQPSPITQAAEERIKVAIHPEYPEQTIAIGSTLIEEGRVLRHLLEHRLNVQEGRLPVRQKKRSQAPERNKSIQEKVAKLIDDGIMKQVHYHSWLSNPVILKKYDDSWRMCVDFKDLNKACLKDGYPLPEIDWKEFGSIYGRFGDQEPHETRDNKGYRRNVQDTTRDKYEAESQKCTFSVEEGMFLGYKINTKGIKVCQNKVESVLSLTSPKCLKYVQKLNGKLASLNRFLSKSAEKSLPFFKSLKKYTKKSDFQWTAKAEAAFKQIKKLIVELPTLTAPMEKEKLIVYLAATRKAIITLLMTEREAKQMPVYFVSRALQGPEINYTLVEKLEAEEELPDPWTFFTHESSYIDGSEAGLKFTYQEGTEFTYALRFRFDATNNEANYEDLIAGLRIAEQMGTTHSKIGVKSCPSVSALPPSPHVLWAYRTIRRANRSLGEGIKETKAVIPAEIGMPTLRTAEIDMVQNDEALEINLDHLEERREQATIHEARS